MNLGRNLQDSGSWLHHDRVPIGSHPQKPQGGYWRQLWLRGELQAQTENIYLQIFPFLFIKGLLVNVQLNDFLIIYIAFTRMNPWHWCNFGCQYDI